MSVTCRSVLDELSEYIPGKPISEVQNELGLADVSKLASNENPFGCSSFVKKAIEQELLSTHLYPDGNCTRLREKLAKKLNVTNQMLIFGNGSDDIIELIPKAFLDRGDESILADITFSLYETNVLLSGASCIKVPLNEHFTYNLPAILQSITKRTKVIWLCNPNNPTGTKYGEAEQRAFIQKVPRSVLVVIDEAYYEYAAGNDYPDSLALLKEYDNVLILRTFSKIYGLASLRVGYGIGNEKIIQSLEKVRSPFNVNSYAQAAACASLDDINFPAQVLQKTQECRNYLEESFQKLGLSYLPSFTNFITVKMPKDDLFMFQELLKRGVIVRPGTNLSMKGYLRITIGTMEECEKLIAALSDLLSF